MASAVDRERETAIALAPHMALVRSERWERGRHIEDCEPVGGRLDVLGDRYDACRQSIEDLEFDPERAVSGACDPGLEFAQFDRGEAHLAGQGLTVDERLVERCHHQAIALPC